MLPIFYQFGEKQCLPKSLHMNPFEYQNNKLNLTAKWIVGLTMGDVFIVVTSLIIGILGALRVLRGIPPAASYSLIALGVVIILAWIDRLLKKEDRKLLKELFYTAFCLSAAPKKEPLRVNTSS